MAGQIIKIGQGGSVTVEYTLVDILGAAINLNNYAGLAVEVYQCEDTILEKYSLNSSTGFEAITVTNATNGVFEFTISGSVTKKAARISDLKCDIWLRDSSNNQYVSPSNSVCALQEVADKNFIVP